MGREIWRTQSSAITVIAGPGNVVIPVQIPALVPIDGVDIICTGNSVSWYVLAGTCVAFPMRSSSQSAQMVYATGVVGGGRGSSIRHRITFPEAMRNVDVNIHFYNTSGAQGEFCIMLNYWSEMP